MARNKKLETPESSITKEQARRNIAEWLYTSDNTFNSKQEWRVALIEMIAWNIKRIK